MPLPFGPPLKPMLGRLTRELPRDGHLYEPKWDGFRATAFVDGDDVDVRSRHDRPLARYFPELVAGLRALPEERLVLDGEIVLAGAFDFPTLMGRLHPAKSRADRLATEAPAAYVAFDLLAIGDEDLRQLPFHERRARLESIGAHPPVHVTPATGDPDVATAWLERFQGAGIDGVIAKPRDGRYEPGARAIAKVKRERTADCVVAGLRFHAGRPMVGSLLLGLYAGDGTLFHVGVASAFPERRRIELLEELRPLAVPLEGHPWEHGYSLQGGETGRLPGAAGRWDPREMALDWVPLAPERVAEVAYDQVDRGRFRHPARFRRWRPDREPGSCTFDQLAADAPQVAELLAAS
ncbi:MAG: ATP-dependent DNA ligase [Actinomycetota bacterium]|nr:ATP-dependent DNA ligase [Actinomycetota bacterium]